MFNGLEDDWEKQQQCMFACQRRGVDHTEASRWKLSTRHALNGDEVTEDTGQRPVSRDRFIFCWMTQNQMRTKTTRRQFNTLLADVGSVSPVR